MLQPHSNNWHLVYISKKETWRFLILISCKEKKCRFLFDTHQNFENCFDPETLAAILRIYSFQNIFDIQQSNNHRDWRMK